MKTEFRFYLLLQIPGFRTHVTRVSQAFKGLTGNGQVADMDLVMPGDPALQELGEAVAIRNMVLDGSLGGSPDQGTYETRLKAATTRHWQYVRESFGEGPYTL